MSQITFLMSLLCATHLVVYTYASLWDCIVLVTRHSQHWERQVWGAGIVAQTEAQQRVLPWRRQWRHKQWRAVLHQWATRHQLEDVGRRRRRWRRHLATMGYVSGPTRFAFHVYDAVAISRSLTSYWFDCFRRVPFDFDVEYGRVSFVDVDTMLLIRSGRFASRRRVAIGRSTARGRLGRVVRVSGAIVHVVGRVVGRVVARVVARDGCRVVCHIVRG